MANDSYVQVATDGTGKKVEMQLDYDAGLNPIYLQKALLVGAPADALQNLLAMNMQQLAVLRAILSAITSISNSPVTEEDFTNIA